MNKIKHLEGLRGVAAFVVLLNHLILTCFITDINKLYQFVGKSDLPQLIKVFIIGFCNLCQNGELAVWIFWLLSSYVISILFFKPSDNYDNVLISYFSKRYIRLFIPVFISIILSYLLLRFSLTFNRQLAFQYGEPYLNGWLDKSLNFPANLYNAIRSGFFDTFFDYQYGNSYNRVLWTIRNEFIGSLFIFSIFGIIRHNKKRFLLYFIITLVLLMLRVSWLIAFVAGYALCDYDFSDQNSSLSTKIRGIEKYIFKHRYITLGIFIVILLLSDSILNEEGINRNACFLVLSFIVVYFTIRNEFLSATLSGRVSKWLGEISFSLYLIHLPILFSFTSYLLLFNTTLYYKLSIGLLTIIICFILSKLYEMFVDKKGVKLANSIGNFFKRHN